MTGIVRETGEGGGCAGGEAGEGGDRGGKRDRTGAGRRQELFGSSLMTTGRGTCKGRCR
jgi:hypothetical protein